MAALSFAVAGPENTARTRLCSLVVDLLVGHVLSLLFPRVEESANPVESLTSDGKDSAHERLAVNEQALTPELLALGRVNAQHVLLALHSLVVGEEHEALGVGVELVRGLLNDGESLVDPREGLVPKLVGPFYVGNDVLVRLAEVGHDGLGEAPVRRVAKL